jgi:hypothetical protein
MVGDVYEILCDKLRVYSTDRLGGRIKDMYHIYLISHIDGLNKWDFYEIWDKIGYEVNIPIFGLSPGNFLRMKKPFVTHSADRFGATDFEDVLERVICFTADLYSDLSGIGGTKGDIWDSKRRMWL